MTEIHIEKCREDAKLPAYAHDGDAGMDLYAAEEVIIEPGRSALVPVGIKLAIPYGYEVQIRPRSGVSLKTPLRIPNAPGTIDCGYRDEVNVIVYNDSFMVEEVEGVTSIWDDPTYSTLTINTLKDESFFNSVTVAGVQKGEGYEVFDLGRSQELAAVIMASAVGYGPQMHQIFAGNDFYQYTYVQAVVTEQYVQVVLALALQGGYYYNVVSTFYNIGSTQAPNLDVLFQ